MRCGSKGRGRKLGKRLNERDIFFCVSDIEQVGQCCQVAVAQVIGNRWKWLGRCLGIDETVIENIQSENESEEERAFQVLRRWLREKGSKATVHLLMKAIGERSNVKAMEAFAHHLGEFHSKETIQDD